MIEKKTSKKIKDIFREVANSFYLFDQNKDACIILFRGKRVVVNSGKSLWNGKGPAKNALNNHLSWFRSQINYYSVDYPDTEEGEQQRAEDLKAFEKWVGENIKIVSLVEYETLQAKLKDK